MKEETKSRLASRKLWMAIGGLLTVLATDWLNLEPQLAESLIAAVVIIVPAYLISQSIPDALKEWAANKKK